MRLVRYRSGGSETAVGVWQDDVVLPLALAGGQFRTLADILESDDRAATVEFLLDRSVPGIPLAEVQLLPPIDEQEVWAAGVTYRRSQTARIEESQGSAWCYERVYDSPRPELFFKATPNRVVGPDQPVRIRRDSKWNVPEPELTLVLNSRLERVGYTIGNDMSSRDIEGENPLYLPQAKVYEACCALGPAITLVEWLPDADESPIELVIRRGELTAFLGHTNTDRMARTFDDLCDWLGRDNRFPNGVFLLTGTGVVPPDTFTLEPDDVVEITVPGIGTLRNPVVQG